MKRKSKIVRLDEIGPVKLIKSPRAKYLNIYVRSSNHVWAAVPAGMSAGRAEMMVRTKKGWILKQQECWRSREARTRQGMPEMPIDSGNILRRELLEYAERYGFYTRNVSIRRQKTRWGSCSRENNISLNIQIMRLPPHLREYVILHELVHTRIKNHGQKFWQALEIICSQAKKRRASLREYGWLLTDSG